MPVNQETPNTPTTPIKPETKTEPEANLLLGTLQNTIMKRPKASMTIWINDGRVEILPAASQLGSNSLNVPKMITVTTPTRKMPTDNFCPLVALKGLLSLVTTNSWYWPDWTRRINSGSFSSSVPFQYTDKHVQSVAMIKAGTVTAKIWIKETSKTARLATKAAMAALIGLATTAIPAEITDAAMGRSGRTLAEAATSATTG